ncbi:MAG: hypothetical protein JST90_18745 [Bacteroidetes bacterium]|nr:hypothetical protein [Bacteroidota bacterium]
MEDNKVSMQSKIEALRREAKEFFIKAEQKEADAVVLERAMSIMYPDGSLHINDNDVIKEDNIDRIAKGTTYKALVAIKLKEHNRFIGSMALTKIIHPTETSDVELSKKRTNISGILSDYGSDDSVSGIIALGKGKSTLWGYKEWLDAEGRVKPEHRVI